MGRVPIGRVDRTAETRYSDRELVRRIAQRLVPERRHVVGLGLLAMAGSLLGILFPLLISQSIDRAIARPTLSVALGLSAVIGAVGLLIWLVDLFRRRTMARVEGYVVLGLRKDLFAATVDQDMRFHDRSATGDLVTQVTSDTTSFGQIVALVSNSMSSALRVVALTVVLFCIDWQLALLALLIVPAIVLVVLGLRHASRPAAVRERKMRAVIRQSIAQAIAGIGVAKVFRQEQMLYDTFDRVNRQSYEIDLRRGLVVESVFPAFFALRAVVTTAMVYAGGLAVLRGRISAGTWYLFVQALGMYVDPLIGLASFWRSFQDGLASCEHIFSLLDTPRDVIQLDDRPVPKLRGEIEFRDLYFRYRPEEPVLSGFSLSVPAGETLAFVGHTGAGKSSLARLIARFYEFQEGNLLVDGQDIRSFDLSQYRRQIGLVPQSPFLFAGTLLDNVRYGVPDATEEQVLAAVRRIGEGDWLADLPAGLETQVGERGGNLSMGQRQLVALARVLIHDPAILVLDEATASVDPYSEVQIQEGLEEVFRDRTSIIIAHRLSTVKNADRIVVLEQGTILEEGTHEELIVRGGHYAGLYERYFRYQEGE